MTVSRSQPILAGLLVIAIGFVGAALVGAWLSRVEEANFVQRAHVPAECSWKEIERDGDWQQTCDENQKRLQR